MHEVAKLVQDKIQDLKKDMNEVLDKHGLGDMRVHEITLSTGDACVDGSHESCQFLGFDPKGKPMYRCVCVPD